MSTQVSYLNLSSHFHLFMSFFLGYGGSWVPGPHRERVCVCMCVYVCAFVSLFPQLPDKGMPCLSTF